MPTLTILHGCATIQLTQGQNTLVDEQDWPTLNTKNWSALWNGADFYAIGRPEPPTVPGKKAPKQLMHRFIRRRFCGEAIDGKHVDHQNCDTLDNRRENIRAATVSQNRCNSRKRKGKSSTFKGVSLIKRSGRWLATIEFRGEHRHLGVFGDETEAARAYNRAAAELYGEFARLNEDV